MAIITQLLANVLYSYKDLECVEMQSICSTVSQGSSDCGFGNDSHLLLLADVSADMSLFYPACSSMNTNKHVLGFRAVYLEGNDWQQGLSCKMSCKVLYLYYRPASGPTTSAPISSFSTEIVQHSLLINGYWCLCVKTFLSSFVS